MSLADQIVERNTKPSLNQEVDEFGIPIPTPETPEYMVARALALNEKLLGENEPRIHGLHTRIGGCVYRGHTCLSEDRVTLLELTRLKRNPKEWEQVEFWRILKECLPKLNRRILQIADGLYWDIEKSELISHKQAEERSK